MMVVDAQIHLWENPGRRLRTASVSLIPTLSPAWTRRG